MPPVECSSGCLAASHRWDGGRRMRRVLCMVAMGLVGVTSASGCGIYGDEPASTLSVRNACEASIELMVGADYDPTAAQYQGLDPVETIAPGGTREVGGIAEVSVWYVVVAPGRPRQTVERISVDPDVAATEYEVAGPLCP